MLYIAFFVLLGAACVLGDDKHPLYSFSPTVGSGSGTSYSLSGEGRVTGVRVWEANNNYIYGFQFRFGYIWSEVVGLKSGNSQEMQLSEGEAIIQLSGKYNHYIQSVVFTTSRGRTLQAGQPSGRSFNFYPEHSMAELCIISGRYHGGITALGAHWAVIADPYTNRNSNSTALW
ncbi:zymogen granule membrane protein 16-like isoform X2 [Cheilinus undulatus]|uniref:zymogen granule membrane protein 16-like isoform X2 n=1 Tax=Cheilinus undulatus TaxID=241271 RepID=UPI001BD2FC82|nr:zymogen granule membrane protein 16-like isoform X2 [Cheilinus undulatus]